VALEELASIEQRNPTLQAGLHARFMVAVFGWLRLKKSEEAPLTGAPAKPRMKTYSAATGYVYQYVFAGQREVLRDRTAGMDYAFDVTYDRKNVHRIWVFITDDALSPWMDENARGLTNSERYGVAKIALRNAFDSREPARIHERIAPDAGEVAAILEELDV
jgi:hypothetical protein